MRVIRTRNGHQALPEALRLLREEGVRRDSRNGPVIVAPFPVALVYSNPMERVVFWPQRNCNPWLHLFEALWMLAGRNDVAPLLRYTKQFAEYSDDGKTLHGAYGHRWRHAFGCDQLDLIVSRLTTNRDDRRCVLQMWDAPADLGSVSKDVPCNLTVTFQIGVTGNLDMVVFNRSNDAIWGALGANLVHFSFLQEYMARRVQVPVGVYTQISTNFHAYTKILDKMDYIPPRDLLTGHLHDDPYSTGLVYPGNMIGNIDETIQRIMKQEPFDAINESGIPWWGVVALRVLHAHHIGVVQKRIPEAIHFLEGSDPKVDWIAASIQWLRRRQERQILRAAKDGETLGEA